MFQRVNLVPEIWFMSEIRYFNVLADLSLDLNYNLKRCW
jgi:hypothetical protein